MAASTSATAADKEDKHLMIVTEPDDNDVLLGQGHYRHPGNQRLNSIVDSKVSEYRTQSRPFKTYMAHEIISSLRNKGARFLKELAPKGWIIVRDDKEAREKVAQRFQYMMRKQADNQFVAKDATKGTKSKAKAAKAGGTPIAPTPEAKPSSTTTTAPVAPVPSTHSTLAWNGGTVKIPFLPVFHQLQKSSVMVDDNVNEVFIRLQDCFRIIGVQESFNHEQANALLTGPENQLKIQMNLWKPLGGNCGVIVELVNTESDHQLFHKYSRYILEAATGLFQKYSHTLFQARGLATSSVQEHVSAFASAWSTADGNHNNNNQHKKTHPTPKVASEEGKEAQAVVKPGMVRDLSDRSLQSKKEKTKTATPGSPAGKQKNKVKLPAKTAKRQEQVKIPPLAPSAKKEANTDARAEIDSTAPCFASAFTRWETGVAAPNDTAEVPPVARRRRPSTTKVVAATAGTLADDNPWEPFPIDTAISLSGAELPKVEQPGEGSVVSMAPAKRSRGTPNVQVATEAAGPPSPKKANCGFETKSNTTDFPTSSSEATLPAQQPVERLPTADPYPLVGWARAASSNQEEMKCDSSVEERLDAEMMSLYHATESIKRLSLSSNDGSCNEPRTVRDINEAFPVGLLPIGLSHQEMKCDSSLDDLPRDDEDYFLPAAQSFLPTSFFGAANPSAFSATLRVPNPPSPAHSFCSHVSVEMRSSEPSPSPSPSFTSHCSIEFSLPSPCGSFNSKCSLGLNSLKHVRMDDSVSPSMLDSDQSAVQDRPPPASPILKSHPSDDSVPPTIFVDSSAATGVPSA
ncbi:expressed unknown protein [Seminavis robusta]|uniref:DUF6824 domain-containing protein n=1 Tax=Seminavis robusta TaxID=568900 RepID=A0A9N8DN94_9STRA|nr:expressed unknown protein [Seminavis robusta]|eukprot:Sro174_g076560.1 n/a (801) ;mRNA; r:19216-21618